MESQPDAQESKLNEQLKSFTRSVLDNDLLATAIVARNNESMPQEEGWTSIGGELSLMPRDDGMILAGIQIGYEHETPVSRSRKYIYTDFFVIDPASGRVVLSEEIDKAAQTIDPEQAAILAEEAWQLWLTKAHGMISRIEGIFADPTYEVIGHTDPMKIVVDKYTGELGPAYNMPPGHAVEINLPPLGTPLAN